MMTLAVLIAVTSGPPVPLLSPVHAQSLPPSVFLEGVVGHPQEHNLSCESRSATDLAAFWGVAFTESDFFSRLPASDNPYCGFVGDVDMPAGTMPPRGYGVYAGPVAVALRSFALDAQPHFGWSLDELKAEIAAGRPVIVWATYGMRRPGVKRWLSSDGKASVVVKWQHTFIVVGYDEEGIYLIDAYDGRTKSFPYNTFLPAWKQLGRMAVTVKGQLPRFRIGGWIIVPGRKGRLQFITGNRHMGETVEGIIFGHAIPAVSESDYCRGKLYGHNRISR